MLVSNVPRVSLNLVALRYTSGSTMRLILARTATRRRKEGGERLATGLTAEI